MLSKHCELQFTNCNIDASFAHEYSIASLRYSSDNSVNFFNFNGHFGDAVKSGCAYFIACRHYFCLSNVIR